MFALSVLYFFKSIFHANVLQALLYFVFFFFFDFSPLGVSNCVIVVVVAIAIEIFFLLVFAYVYCTFNCQSVSLLTGVV